MYSIDTLSIECFPYRLLASFVGLSAFPQTQAICCRRFDACNVVFRLHALQSRQRSCPSIRECLLVFELSDILFFWCSNRGDFDVRFIILFISRCCRYFILWIFFACSNRGNFDIWFYVLFITQCFRYLSRYIFSACDNRGDFEVRLLYYLFHDAVLISVYIFCCV